MTGGQEFLGWALFFGIIIGAAWLVDRRERKHHRRDSLWIKSFRERGP